MSTEVAPGESVSALGENTARVPRLWPPAAYETIFRRSSDRANARSGLVRRLRTRRFLRLAWPRPWPYVCEFSMASGWTSSFSLLNLWTLLDRRINSRRSKQQFWMSVAPFRHRGVRRHTHGPSPFDDHDTCDTSSGLLVKNKIGFVSQNVAAGPHRFCLGDLRRRTPGPPPFSSMNSIPAASKVRRIA